MSEKAVQFRQPKARIKRVTMKHFRGATLPYHIEFNLTKPLVMLFGENGCGKSTIVDAIDWVCNESKGSMGERSGTRSKEHLPSLGKVAADVEVEIAFEGGSWTGRLGKNGKLSTQGSGERPTVRVLRRASLLRLSESAPAERYNELKSFIEVTQVERSESRLLEALQLTGRQLEDAIKNLQETESLLVSLHASEGASGSVQTWARHKIERDPIDLRQDVTVRSEYIHAFEGLERLRLSWRASQGQQETLTQQLEQHRGEVQQRDLPVSLELLRLLEQAQHYLRHAPHAQSCPLCERPAEAQVLENAVAQRLEQASSLQALSGQIDHLERHLEYLETDVLHQGNTLLEGTQRLRQRQFVLWATEDMEVINTAQQAAQWLESQSSVITPLRLQLEKLQGDLGAYTAIRNLFERYSELTEQVKSLDLRQKRLKAVAEVIRLERSRYVQNIFDAVTTQCQRLYAHIHPRESLGLERLVLDETRKGSLHQQGQFYGQSGVTPQGFYSEAHLDTLGFCFWLAVVRHTTVLPIIVLDDVFTSVDAAHLSRIGDLLLEEAKHFGQVIVTTHYRGWLEKFKFELNNNLDLHELQGWTLERGLRSHQSKSTTQDLESVLNVFPFDRQSVASKAGVLLETLLESFTLELECTMKRSRGGYALDALLTAVKKPLKDEWKLERQHLDPSGHALNPSQFEIIDIWSPFDRLFQLRFIRNQVGAHFNILGSEVSDQDVQEFGECTLAFAQGLLCPKCGRVVFKNQKLKNRECGCGHSRFMPR